MKSWLLNPRFETRKSPFDPGPGISFVVIDCPCGCLRPFPLPPIPGSFEPDPQNPPTTQLQWRLLLNGCTYPGVTFRVADTADRPCGWIGKITAGRIWSLTDVENDNKFGTRIQETLQKLRERGDIQSVR